MVEQLETSVRGSRRLTEEQQFEFSELIQDNLKNMDEKSDSNSSDDDITDTIDQVGAIEKVHKMMQKQIDKAFPGREIEQQINILSSNSTIMAKQRKD